MNHYDVEKGDAAFNFSMLFYGGLHQLRIKKSEACISNNIPLYYEILDDIYNTIFFQVKKKSNTEIENIRGELDKAYKLIFTNFPETSLGQDVKQLSYIKAKKMLKDADKNLHVIMDKHGMIFPNVEAKGGIDKIKKRYGLNE